jgi:hypothetical protein
MPGTLEHLQGFLKSRQASPPLDPRDALNRIDWLVGYCAQKEIALNPSCQVLQLRNAVAKLVNALQCEPQAVPAGLSKAGPALFSLLQLATGVGFAVGTPLEESLVKHLPVIGKGDQVRHRAGANDKNRNLGFEILTACTMNLFAEDVRLEDPPDVLLTFEGRRWGVACKTLNGSPDRIVNLVRDGRDQLAKAPCDAGVVLVETTNVMDPNAKMDAPAPNEQAVEPTEEPAPAFVPGIKGYADHVQAATATNAFLEARHEELASLLKVLDLDGGAKPCEVVFFTQTMVTAGLSVSCIPFVWPGHAAEEECDLVIWFEAVINLMMLPVPIVKLMFR